MCEDFTIIAGPCSAESEEQVLQTAFELSNSLKPDFFRAGVWKPRTRPGSFEGAGSKALVWLNKVQTEFGIPAITEAGCATHIEKIFKHGLNAFWLGARTVANPFSVQEIVSACDKKDIQVFVKNPIHPDIELWIGAIERFLVAGVKSVYAIHRGFYPYEKTYLRNIPRWEIPIELARRFPQVKIICDPSHIAGKPEYISEISQRAIDLNMCGIMVETHYNPQIALSDKEQQIKPAELANIISKLNFRKSFSTNSDFQNKLNDFREKIDAIDFQLIDMLEHRFKLVDEIGKLKIQNNITILQLERWKTIVESRLKYANPDNINQEFLLKILQMIHKESILRQNKIFDENK